LFVWLCRILVLTHPSCVWRLRDSLLAFLPWWNELLGDGAGGSSFNKLGGSQVGSRFFLYRAGHRGGGHKMEKRWSLRIWRLGSKFSSAFEERRWRLLALLSFAGGDGGRWPASSSPTVTLLAEWRLLLFLPAMEPIGRQRSVQSMAMASAYGSFVVPSGPVPRRRRGANRVEAEDLIAFPFLCLRSFLQSLRTSLYFLLFSGSGCKMSGFP
jgi:hypothetical protein